MPSSPYAPSVETLRARVEVIRRTLGRFALQSHLPSAISIKEETPEDALRAVAGRRFKRQSPPALAARIDTPDRPCRRCGGTVRTARRRDGSIGPCLACKKRRDEGRVWK